MHVVVIANGEQQNEFIDKPVPDGVKVQYVTTIDDAHDHADVYFYLLDDGVITKDSPINKLSNLVLVNAVHSTLEHLPTNCARINAWPGFLLGKAIELAVSNDNKDAVDNVFKTLNWSYQLVPDVIGFITPRTIAMIVNEAYYALSEDVSTKEDIDTAMKLGTGYPFGPFEWAAKIGLKRIATLLSELAKSDDRYQPAPLLLKEAGV